MEQKQIFKKLNHFLLAEEAIQEAIKNSGQGSHQHLKAEQAYKGINSELDVLLNKLVNNVTLPDDLDD